MSRKTQAAASVNTQEKAPKFTHGALLRDALTWVVNERMFADVRLHGNIKWKSHQLVILAVLWVWSGRTTLGRAYVHARRLSRVMFGWVAVKSYQGLTGALKTWSVKLLPRTQKRMQELMEEVGGEHWRIGLWVALAVDGSRVTTPRTQSNEKAFSAKNYGHGKKAKSRRKWKNRKKRSKKLSAPVKPQMWITLIWHMGLKMPWTWKTGASTSSERHHLMDMLKTETFPENTLFCGDAGFVGYDFWNALLDNGHHFLVRVGANVRLIKNLGHARERDGIVYVWPDAAARRKQPPLVLRLIQIKNERGTMSLVTSVLNERRLSNAKVAQVYSMRWGIELQFRSFKQTFGRRELHSRTSECSYVEMDWSLVGLWMIQLFAVKEQIKVDRPPEHSSVSLSLAIIQETMDMYHEEATDGRALSRQLSDAVKDDYTRTSSKIARYQPNNKDKPSAKEPIVRKATAKQKQTLRRLNLPPAVFT
ncbi:MAG: transposase [Planctomycetaceae bacterium]